MLATLIEYSADGSAMEFVCCIRSNTHYKLQCIAIQKNKKKEEKQVQTVDREVTA